MPLKEKRFLIIKMKKYIIDNWLHLAIIGVFVIISAIYFYPVLEGQGLRQGDYITAIGMQKELKDFHEATGEYSGWTNSMFSGMPSYQISGTHTFNIHNLLMKILRFALPYTTMAIFFIYLLGFYFMLSSLKFRKSIAVIGALAFALSSYNIIIIAAGHITKCYAIAYMPAVLAGVIYLFDKKYIAGFLILTFSLGIEIACNHPQILYYLAILCATYVAYKFILLFVEKKDDSKQLLKACGISAIAIIFAVLPNIANLWTTWEYGKYSTRSQSELTSRKQSSGLDKDYAFAWSYGKAETMTLLIPNFKGGATGYLNQDETALKAISESGDRQISDAAGHQNHYWGNQPFTSGPVYAGAVIVFLFVLGLLIVKNSIKWWLLGATIISMILSWGNNAAIITDLLFDYFPLFNKFRSVSMALVIAQVCIPFLAMIALKEYSENPEYFNSRRKDFYIAIGITGGLCLLFWLFPGITETLSDQETASIAEAKALENGQYAAQYDILAKTMENARKSILSADALRSLLFIIATVIILALFGMGRMKAKIMFVAIALLVVADMWIVDYRYLGPKDYVTQSQAESEFQVSPADNFILKDSDPNFRVLNLNANVFNDAKTSYFHKSIGGYHGAKLRRYQEFIDTILATNVYAAQRLTQMYHQNQKTLSDVNDFVTNNPAFNMLNTKFIIYDPQQIPIINMNTCGNAWFVNKYELVESADQEIGSLTKNNPKETAVINKNMFKDFVATLPQDQITLKDSGVISLAEYKPNYLKYNSLLPQKERLAVFSEIYYPKGWNAYIDGKPTQHVCADYILRAMVVPAGEHTIEFKFEPTSVKVGTQISTISSILLIIALVAYIINRIKTKETLTQEIEKI